MQEINIDVYLNEKEDLFNPYNKGLLKQELVDYILNQFKGYSLKGKVTINLISNLNFSEKEKANIIETFKNNFQRGNMEDDLYNQINRRKSIFLFIFGILFITLSYFLEKTGNYIGTELVLIIGWVAIWELCDYLLFEETKNKIKSKRIDQLSMASFVFKDL